MSGSNETSGGTHMYVFLPINRASNDYLHGSEMPNMSKAQLALLVVQ